MSADCGTFAAMLKALRAHTMLKSPRLAEGQPEKPLVEGNLASQLNRF
jgi:hypothetical protein